MNVLDEIYRQLERENKKRECFYVTDLGVCPRKVIMGFGDFEYKPLTPQEKLMFGFADFLHYKVMLFLRESKNYVVIKNEYKINDGLPEFWHGRCDDLLYDLSDKYFFPLEIKSTRSFVKNMDLPKENHVMQTKIYIYALRNMGWDIPKGKLLYIDRSGSNKPIEFDIELDDSQPILDNFKIYEDWYEKQIFETNGEYSHVMMTDTMPPILPRTINKSKNEFYLVPDWQCGYCKYQGLSCKPNMSKNKIAEIKDNKLVMRKGYEEYEKDIVGNKVEEDDFITFCNQGV
jgi:hypothetical protein